MVTIRSCFRHIAFPLFLLAMGACAGPKATIVLLPQEDGSSGAVEISNAAGTQVADSPNQAIRVTGKDVTPNPPTIISETEISKEWGSVLRVSPLNPKTFYMYFQFGTDKLTLESQEQFPRIFQELKRYPAAELSIVGHTDRAGAAALNAALSLKRAQTTLRLLMEAGLEHSRTEVESHGENNPLIPTADGVAEPRNRRVEVTIR